jgi:hypothetical protein
MTFDTSAYLRRATGRAKSDVANKLVSMFLHDVSRKLYASLDLSVSDPRYTESVSQVFGSVCCYCGGTLERDRASVEHLDGMNRFRVGLHIPGNVIVACTRCNREKRRDDSLATLVLAESGWESFLSHNGTKCKQPCNSCSYWQQIWPEQNERLTNLRCAREKITAFRAKYAPYLEVNNKARLKLATKIDAIYRDCQHFAATRIKEAVEDICGSETGATALTAPAVCKPVS